jgi:hypothetical protein
MTNKLRNFGWWSAVLALALATAVMPIRAVAQDQDQGGDQDDPPTRVARLGYIEGSVSFQPAGEDDWVGAVPNRPMTTGDKLWSDKDSRVELQLGSATIRLSENTGFSFLNLDDHTVQIQLTSGTINVRVRRLDQDDDFEVDTPNLAFTVSQPGSYRVEASEDGTYTVVSLRDGGGQATGNGQTYTLHAGQRGTFDGTDSLNADVEDIGGPDQFDNWADGRDHRYDDSPSRQYLSQDVVGYEDLDQNGDWRDDSNYGHVWYPHIEAGWAPYHTGHWDWIAPWGYTWVDDSNWGYAPFHYGRWVTIGGRWGWIAGPVAVRAVYAPALVVFIGGGPGGFGGNVGWFPLGPREVYVPPYQVSRGYMNQVNISNTTVNTTIVTNVYNTTIINKTTNITNITYANRGVQGAVMVVPQRAFAGAQPVARAAVSVNAQQIASASVNARVAVVPTRESVLGAKASTAGHVSAPPAAVQNRQVIAKRTPPPPPVPFARQQQALAAHPGQPIAPREMQSMRPAGAAAARPMVKQAPPGKPATATVGHPNQPNAGRPGQPTPAANQPANRPPNQQQPNQPRPNQANPNQANPGQPNPNQRPANQEPPANNNRPPPSRRSRIARRRPNKIIGLRTIANRRTVPRRQRTTIAPLPSSRSRVVPCRKILRQRLVHKRIGQPNRQPAAIDRLRHSPITGLRRIVRNNRRVLRRDRISPLRDQQLRRPPSANRNGRQRLQQLSRRLRVLNRSRPRSRRSRKTKKRNRKNRRERSGASIRSEVGTGHPDFRDAFFFLEEIVLGCLAWKRTTLSVLRRAFPAP